MKRAIAALLLIACNQRDAPMPSRAPAPANPAAAAPREIVPPDAPPPPVAVVPSDAARPADDLQAEAARYADLLTADGPSVADVDTHRRPGADLQAQMDEVRDSGKTVAIGGGSHGGGTAGALVGPGTDTPRGRITVVEKQAFDDTSLTADQVLAKIMASYMAGLRHCYRERLAKDPNARGKVTLALTVNTTGRAVNDEARAFDDDLGACMTAQLRAWRFAIPKDADGEPTEASYAVTLQLVPD